MISQEISQSLLDRYRKVTAATVYGGVRRLGFEPCFMRGVQAFMPGKIAIGKAEGSWSERRGQSQGQDYREEEERVR